MFSLNMLQKDATIRAQEEAYKALQTEYYNVINSTFWRRSQWLRNLINKVRGNKQAKLPEELLPTTHTVSPGVNIPRGRMSPEVMLEALKEFDVVSFDIFDTLILRNCKEPADVFNLIGLKLGQETFSKLRIEAEAQARENITEGEEREVTLREIYEILTKWLPMDMDDAMETEISTEVAICTANPFMKKVFDTLRAMGKGIVIVSDMYLSKEAIERILKGAGYFGYSKLYVSSEYKKSKATGTLYELVKEELGDKSVIHIGDNYQSDVINAQMADWSTYYYPRVKTIAGNRFNGCQSPVGSFYSGLAANRLCSEPLAHGVGYGHGYAYGGILSVGYVKWLDDFAKQQNADKILFLARDSEIFDVIYRKHINRIPSKYTVVSRFSMWQIVFHLHPEEYIRFFFYPRALQENTLVKDALTETGLDFLLDKMEEYGFTEETVLNKDAYKILREMIYDNKDVITDKFAPMRQAATQYFNECFGDSKKVLVSDVGWSGQILLHMRHFVKHVMHRDDIEIIGAYMANSISKNVNHYVNNGTMNAYLFAYGQNRDMSIPNDTWYGNTAVMCYEAMFSSVAPTLMLYKMGEDGKYQFQYGGETGEAAVINDLQLGILDFAYDYFKLINKLGMNFNITAADAFTPYETIAMDWPYLANVFGDFKEYADSLPRLGKTREQITIREIMQTRALL